MRYTAIVIAFVVATAASPASSQVVNPWVLAEDQPDTRSLEHVARTVYRNAGAESPREKAEALWRFLLTDGRFVSPEGLMFYHIAGWAYEEPLGEVLDPLKLLNSYGFGLCYQDGPLLAALWEAGGFEDARCWFLTGHTVAEVFYDGSYHMLDSDMLGYTTVGDRDPLSSPIASVRQLEEDGTIITGKLLAPDRVDSTRVVHPWYPADVRARAMEGYAGIFTSTGDNWLYPFQRYSGGHTMDFVLRPGERLVRCYEPGARGLYYLPYKEIGGSRSEFPREIERYNIYTADGPHSQKDSRRWGTGSIEYAPPLERRASFYQAWREGFCDNLSLPSAPGGALGRAERGRPATAVFAMPSPWVLIDAVFSLTAELPSPAHRLIIETSTDEGRSWQPAGSLRGPFNGPWRTSPEVVEVSANGALNAVSGQYGYLIRVTMNGPVEEDSPDLGIRDLKLASIIQLNPRTLPRLGRGANSLAYSPGRQLVRHSHPVELSRLGDFALRAENLFCMVEKGNRLLVPQSRGRAEAVFEAGAPGGVELTEVMAGGRFLVLEGLAPEKTTAETRGTGIELAGRNRARASIAWATDPGGPFTTLWEYSPASKWLDGHPVERQLVWPEVDRTVSGLPAGTRKIYLRYRLEGMALDDVRLSSFTAPERTGGRLLVTHQWRSRGRLMSRTVEITDPAEEFEYTVDTGRWADVENVRLVFECPVNGARPE